MITSEQAAARQEFIGASDASTAIGVNPYKTPYELWLDKTGQAEPFAGNEATYWGNLLEAPVAQRLSEETGLKLRRHGQTIIAKDHDFMGCHLDYKVTGSPIAVEIKTGGLFTRDNWGKTGTDQIPDNYLVQVHHQMICSGYSQALVGVLLGGQEFRHYLINFDESLAKIIIEKEREFWRHVTDKTPPPPNNLSDIASLHPKDNGAAIEATADIIAELDQLKTLKQSMSSTKSQADAVELRIKSFLADNTTLTDSSGKALATWKAQSSNRIDTAKLKKEQPELCKQFTKTNESRVLRLKS